MDNLQKHAHSDYCHRNKSCCFGFPNSPTTKTLISRPPIDDNDEIIQNAKSVLQTVQNTLTTVDVDVVTYKDALKISKRVPNVILQQNPQDVFINACNHDILSLWGEMLTSNMSLMRLQQ